MPQSVKRISNTTYASSNSWTRPRMASYLADLFSSLVTVFDKASLRWYVFGAQAAVFYGSPRLTADVDVTVLLGEYPLDDLLDLLQQEGFEVRMSDIHTLVRKTKVLPVVHTQSNMPVDIIIGGPGLEEQFAEFARSHDLDGVSVPIVRSEDLIAMKILAGRDKDLQDVSSILKSQATGMDINDIRSTLKDIEVALDRSDLIPVLDNLIDQATNRSHESE